MTRDHRSASELSALRAQIASGEYRIDAQRVALSIVRTLTDVSRARRSLTGAEDGRSRPAG